MAVFSTASVITAQPNRRFQLCRRPCMSGTRRYVVFPLGGEPQNPLALLVVGDTAVLCIADDGQGFDPQAPRPERHLGLWSMRERAEQLGGRFEIISAPGQGTVLTAEVPV
jgi:two-component sensor histidine kinase